MSVLNSYAFLQLENLYLKQKADELQQQLNEANKYNSELKQINENVTKQIDELKAENETLKRRISVLENKLKEKDNEIDRLKTSIAMLLKDKEDRDNILYIGEVIKTYGESIKKKILTKSKYNEFKNRHVNELLKDKHNRLKLSDEELSNKEKIVSHIQELYNTAPTEDKTKYNGLKNLMNYLSNVKVDRNNYSHPIIDKTTLPEKQPILYNYVLYYLEDNELTNKLVSNIINTICGPELV